ncbi:Heat shock protein beta-1 [Amphibalanus amphitrite]|uniref:Heat shock protein beta-1 n=1 Tax=Amphibalanus amphitrite TaxID=1232801 RepID=A0A6A4X9N3_AMPAM|nr:heat shock protein beta-6-like isoform X2 [Amphibalanus amphitrite]XP_043237442.1 heat shock protein beta-6-like isoform X2 [Amphibalanus amphitrite]KAF0311131.1 Heat shock protein beta-1 [Amphibalanus amphitrite]
MARQVPIKMGDHSVIDTEFSSIRERFDAEMRKMEDEMTRFRSELLHREEPRKHSSITSSSTTTTSSHQTSGTNTNSNTNMDLARCAPPHNWIESLNSPLVQEDGDKKHLKLRFDVSQYKPEEIVVKTVDNKLLVHAKHEEKSDSRSVYREYNREFLLPQGSNPEMIKSSLSKDGVLTVEAPLPPALGGTNHIPITNK